MNAIGVLGCVSHGQHAAERMAEYAQLIRFERQAHRLDIFHQKFQTDGLARERLRLRPSSPSLFQEDALIGAAQPLSQRFHVIYVEAGSAAQQQ